MFKNKQDSKQNFTIKKYTFGVVSALVGVFLAVGANAAQAEEVNSIPITKAITSESVSVTTTAALKVPTVPTVPVITTQVPESEKKVTTAEQTTIVSGSVVKEDIKTKDIEFSKFDENKEQKVYININQNAVRPSYNSVIYDKNDRPFYISGGQLNGEVDSTGRYEFNKKLDIHIPDGDYTHVFKTYAGGGFETLENGKISYGAYGFNITNGKITESPVTDRFKDITSYNTGKLNLNFIKEPGSNFYYGIVNYDTIDTKRVSLRFEGRLKNEAGTQIGQTRKFNPLILNGTTYDSTYSESLLDEGNYVLEYALTNETDNQVVGVEQLKFRITATGEVEIDNPKTSEVVPTPKPEEKPEVGVTPTPKSEEKPEVGVTPTPKPEEKPEVGVTPTPKPEVTSTSKLENKPQVGVTPALKPENTSTLQTKQQTKSRALPKTSAVTTEITLPTTLSAILGLVVLRIVRKRRTK